MKNKFKAGDFIKRKKHYDGEHDNLIVKVDCKKKCYEVAWMKGKHSKKADFDNLELIDFDIAHDFFDTVG